MKRTRTGPLLLIAVLLLAACAISGSTKGVGLTVVISHGADGSNQMFWRISNASGQTHTMKVTDKNNVTQWEGALPSGGTQESVHVDIFSQTEQYSLYVNGAFNGSVSYAYVPSTIESVLLVEVHTKQARPQMDWSILAGAAGADFTVDEGKGLLRTEHIFASRQAVGTNKDPVGFANFQLDGKAATAFQYKLP